MPCRSSAAPATRGSSRSSASCAMPRSCRSTRGPTRSSGWSSPSSSWAGSDRPKPPQARETTTMSERNDPKTLHRRTFLKTAGAVAGTVALGFPAVLRAQAPTVKIGVIHTVTGPLAEPGQACRLGAQMLMGPFSSGDAAAMVPVVQQRRVPFLIDIAAADPITANVAKAVREGQQKVQYVYRNFPTGSMFGQRAVQYFNDVFKAAGVSPKRVVLMYANDLFGQNQAKGFQAAHKAASPGWEIVDVIPWPEPPADLSTEVSRAKAAKPDIIAPITRPASAQLLLPQLAKH